jgi:hypothetical protein
MVHPAPHERTCLRKADVKTSTQKGTQRSEMNKDNEEEEEKAKNQSKGKKEQKERKKEQKIINKLLPLFARSSSFICKSFMFTLNTLSPFGTHTYGYRKIARSRAFMCSYWVAFCRVLKSLLL